MLYLIDKNTQCHGHGFYLKMIVKMMVKLQYGPRCTTIQVDKLSGATILSLGVIRALIIKRDLQLRSVIILVAINQSVEAIN